MQSTPYKGAKKWPGIFGLENQNTVYAAPFDRPWTQADSALNYIKNKQQEQHQKRLALDPTCTSNDRSDNDQLTRAGRQIVF